LLENQLLLELTGLRRVTALVERLIGKTSDSVEAGNFGQ
jgi:hypothetical protein